jgi:predicted transposase YbfD/YdcC
VRTVDKGHGRLETRELWRSDALNGYLTFPHVGQVFAIRRTVERNGKAPTVEVVHGVTSLTSDRADAARLLALVRGHWAIENGLHWVRDVTFDEDRSQVRTGAAPQVLAALRNTAIGLLRLAGATAIRPVQRYLADSKDIAMRLLGVLPPPVDAPG